MTQKTLLVTRAAVSTKQPLSPIAQIRRGRQPLSACTEDGAHPPVNTGSAAPTRTTASIEYSTDISLLSQLLDAVRARARERERYLKEREVLAIAGRSKAAMRRDVSLGRFPAHIKTGIKSSAWRESEVMGWVEATTILSRVANPGFSMEEFVAALMASRVSM
jgi:predicted DNA-binding transcriptional regulator AlpA